jgi:hypothetical protein
MRLLELFSGTGSIGRAFVDKGWDVISVDLDPKANPTITANLMTWDYTIHEPGYFNCVWASPPCTHYSIARTTAKTPRDLEGSDKLVQRVLEIIAYHAPSSFFLENPQSGLMKTRAVVEGLEFVDTSYCKYSFTYRKNTRFWTNCKYFKPQPMCCRLSPCEIQAQLDHHESTAQRGPGRLQRKLKTNDRQSLNQLYSMPKPLCDEIAVAANLSQVAVDDSKTETPTADFDS